MKNLQQVLKILFIKKELFLLECHSCKNHYSFAFKAREFLSEINIYRNMSPEINKIIVEYEQMIWDTLMLYATDLETRNFKI